VFILKRLRPGFLVSVDSKDVYVAITYLADGSPVAGLGRSMLRPYVCSEIKRREKRRADIDVSTIKDSGWEFRERRGALLNESSIPKIALS
jgi:hypothetical protein